MKFVIAGAFQPPRELVPLALAAEEAGFEAIGFSDHVVYPEKLDTPYPYTEDGSFPGGFDMPWLDPLGTLTFVAAVTERLESPLAG